MIDDLIQLCECGTFKARFGVTLDSQDLRDMSYTCCPYCHTPFRHRPPPVPTPRYHLSWNFGKSSCSFDDAESVAKFLAEGHTQ